jgi:CheY-like chemotaxis protein
MINVIYWNPIFDKGIGMKILVVDDSQTARQLTKRCLQELGHVDIIESANGMEALQRLADTPGIELVLLDRYMPNMDGLQFMSQFKQNPAFRKVRVSMVTTEDKSDEKMRAIADYEADYYIIKPITTQALVRMFAKLFPSYAN